MKLQLNRGNHFYQFTPKSSCHLHLFSTWHILSCPVTGKLQFSALNSKHFKCCPSSDVSYFFRYRRLTSHPSAQPWRKPCVAVCLLHLFHLISLSTFSLCVVVLRVFHHRSLIRHCLYLLSPRPTGTCAESWCRDLFKHSVWSDRQSGGRACTHTGLSSASISCRWKWNCLHSPERLRGCMIAAQPEKRAPKEEKWELVNAHR